MEVFSSRLKWLREKNKLSQQDMADHLGLSQSYYGRFERNKGEPNLDTLSKLPSIIGESLEFMLGLTDFTKTLEGMNVEISFIQHKCRTFILSSLSLQRNSDHSSVDEDIAKLQFAHYESELEEYYSEFNRIKKAFIGHLESIPMISEKTRERLELVKSIENKEDMLRIRL